MGNLDVDQRSGTYGFEACDEGVYKDDIGCENECTEINPMYECLEWGAPCTPLCGNGHIEVYEEDEYDGDGVLVNARGDPKPVAYA